MWEKTTSGLSGTATELPFNLDQGGRPSPPPLPAIRTSIARRRLLTKVVLGVAIAWLCLYCSRTWRHSLGWGGSGEGNQAEEEGLSGKYGDIIATTRQPESQASENDAVRPVSFGYTGPDPDHLVHGLLPVIENPSDLEPTSSLGLEAEYAYQWGPTTLADYKADLDAFIENHFPAESQSRLRSDLDRYFDAWTPARDDSLPVLGGTGISRKIYMTDKDASREGGDDVSRWKANKDGWEVIFLDDAAGETFVDRNLGSSTLKQVWDALPSGILRSDMLRYTLLYLNGGIYTDIDTKPLKPLSEWGQNPDLFRQGRGWLFPSDREEEPSQKEIEQMKLSLGPASVVVGVESDVGDREDWHDWWPRPLQIVQWTIGSAPRHPIFLDTLLGIARATSRAYAWSRDQHTARSAGTSKPVASSPDIAAEPKEGGPVGVMDWTGPGVWTDSVLRYLRVKYGVRWKDLTRLARPVRIGEVVVLPVTGFSPGVGNFGAMSKQHPEAMVEHRFAGSWKPPRPED